MHKIFYVTIPLLALLAGCSPKVVYTNNPPPQQNPPAQPYSAPPQPVYADQYPVDQPQTNQVFYDELSPYGNWIDYPGEGYVWQPNVDADFVPYDTNGSWVYSDYGWTWASNYSWGWATFHYGNWFYDDSYGWLWEPGQQWAPAWVTWGQSGNYYGWAPVPPQRQVNAGWTPRNNDWNFVAAGQIANSNVNRYVVRNNVNVINNTTVINNVTNNYTTNNVTNNNTSNNRTTVVYNRGPKIDDVENITHTKIQKVTINQSSKPGEGLAKNQLSIYRPVIKPSPEQGNAGTKPAPKQVVTYNKNTPVRQPSKQNVPGAAQNQGGSQFRGRPPLRQSVPGDPKTPNPPQGNQPAPQNQKPANSQGSSQNPNNLQRPNNQNNKPKVDTSKKHVKKLPPPQKPTQQN